MKLLTLVCMFVRAVVWSNPLPEYFAKITKDHVYLSHCLYISVQLLCVCGYVCSISIGLDLLIHNDVNIFYATGGLDFDVTILPSSTFAFSHTQREHCFSVTITDDKQVETDEVFTVVVRFQWPFMIQNDTVTITVQDTDRTFSDSLSCIHAGAI